MNYLGILIFLIMLSIIPLTFIFIHHLDRLDLTRADQVEDWIRGYLNGTPASSTPEED